MGSVGDAYDNGVSLAASASVTATSIVNHGRLTLQGNGANEAQLAVGSAAGFGTSGTVSGSVALTGNAAIQFTGGSIKTIGADGALSLDGANALLTVAGSTATNSALTGLTEVDGGFALNGGAPVQTGPSLTNDAILTEDASRTIFGNLTADAVRGGSLLSVTSRFDNENQVTIGNSAMALSDGLSSASLLNNGQIRLYGNGAAHGTLAVSGLTTNNGDMVFNSDVQTVAGPVAGFGRMFMYSGTTLEFDGGVAASQSAVYGGADRLVLGAAKSFAGSIQGFASSDTIDVKHFGAASTLSYAGDGSSGVLSVTSGANVAQLSFTGAYTTASFVRSSDGAGGLLISHA